MLCRILGVEERYDICAEALNGAEAVYLARKWKPEIILDLPMLVMNGLEAARYYLSGLWAEWFPDTQMTLLQSRFDDLRLVMFEPFTLQRNCFRHSDESTDHRDCGFDINRLRRVWLYEMGCRQRLGHRRPSLG